MSDPTDRLAKLRAMLEKSPGDTFLLYAVAMETKKSGDARAAIECFATVIRHDPNYCYAYHQKGLLFESIGEIDQAKQAYREGIEAAQRKGDGHAREEIAAALSMID